MRYEVARKRPVPERFPVQGDYSDSAITFWPSLLSAHFRLRQRCGG